MLLFTRRLLVALNVLNWLGALFFVTILATLTAHVPWIEARLARTHPDDMEAIRISSRRRC